MAATRTLVAVPVVALTISILASIALTIVTSGGSGNQVAFAQENVPPEAEVTGSGPNPADKIGARTFGSYYGDSSSPEPTASEPGLMIRYLKALGWLLLVLCLAFGTILGLKKLRDGGSRVFRGSNPRLLEVVSRTVIGPKHQLLIVRIGERALVLGVAPEGIRRVCELTEPSEVLAAAKNSESFREQLDEEEGSYPEEEATSAPEDALSPYRREIERLQAMVGNWRFSQRMEGTS